jgi:hypothetical protein
MGGEVFSYRIDESADVRVFWDGRCVTSVRGTRASKLVAELENADPQRVQSLLQRATGNFKRGNERSSRRR